MRTLSLLIISLLLLTGLSYSQEEILNVIKDKAEETISEQIEGGDEKTEAEESNSTAEAEDNAKKPAGTQDKQNAKDVPALKSFSRFDFVPGETVFFYDDFASDNLGDFPSKWNTSGTGEVVTLNNYPGKWFKLKNGSGYVPETAGKFPENFSIEFDYIASTSSEDPNLGEINMAIVASNGSVNDFIEASLGGVNFNLPVGYTYVYIKNDEPSRFFAESYDGQGNGNTSISEINDMVLSGKMGRPVHVSILVNKQRFRIWYDDKKIYDLPKFFYPADYSRFRLALWGWGEENPYEVLIGNFRMAAGRPDVRSRLLTEGKLVTRGITFDPGSYTIKPESYGTMKEIAAILKENSGIRVRIIGHTDSDGTDASNMELSAKRSESIKEAMTGVFGIEASRMETLGKGESEPTDKNDTPEGKANNRRVEFIKL